MESIAAVHANLIYELILTASVVELCVYFVPCESF